MNRYANFLALTLLLTASFARADTQAPYDEGWTIAIGSWLPHFDWAHARSLNGTADSPKGIDYFACPGASSMVTFTVHNFDSAAAGCPTLERGPQYRLRAEGMDHGWVVYDASHRILFYSYGCCSEEEYILTSGVGPPPKPVPTGDLSAVRTHRGVSLGMTIAAVTAIYDPAAPPQHAASSGLAQLTYGSGKVSAPTDCDQQQMFGFKNGRLTYIDLAMGC